MFGLGLVWLLTGRLYSGHNVLMKRSLTADEQAALTKLRDEFVFEWPEVAELGWLEQIAVWSVVQELLEIEAGLSANLGDAIRGAVAAGFEWSEIGFAAGRIDDLSDRRAVDLGRMAISKQFRRWLAKQ